MPVIHVKRGTAGAFRDNGGMSTKADRIRAALGALSPTHLEVLDESHMHSRGLETHYKAIVASDAFSGLAAVRRHQAVYAALGGLMTEITRWRCTPTRRASGRGRARHRIRPHAGREQARPRVSGGPRRSAGGRAGTACWPLLAPAVCR